MVENQGTFKLSVPRRTKELPFDSMTKMFFFMEVLPAGEDVEGGDRREKESDETEDEGTMPLFNAVSLMKAQLE